MPPPPHFFPLLLGMEMSFFLTFPSDIFHRLLFFFSQTPSFFPLLLTSHPYRQGFRRPRRSVTVLLPLAGSPHRIFRPMILLSRRGPSLTIIDFPPRKFLSCRNFSFKNVITFFTSGEERGDALLVIHFGSHGVPSPPEVLKPFPVYRRPS